MTQPGSVSRFCGVSVGKLVLLCALALGVACGDPAASLPPTDADGESLDGLVDSAGEPDIVAEVGDIAVKSDQGADIPIEVDAAGADASDVGTSDGLEVDAAQVPACGDGTCDDALGETLATCPIDCHKCPDGICSPGEGPNNCPEDCCGGCGDHKCVGYACGENPTTCPVDCGTPCGDSICEKGENPGNCPVDCLTHACGNHVCEPSDGGPTLCPTDCGSACGNCVCDKGEDFVSCPNDCGYCGDGVCSLCTGLNETPADCTADCSDFKLVGCTSAWQMFCTDAQVCTDDTCVAGKGCVHLPIAATCDDGDVCTVGDHCVLGACQAGGALPCDDGKLCTLDYCLLPDGCTHTLAPGLPCTDGDPCTLFDSCLGGVCKSGAPLNCADGNVCTDDACQDGGCQFLPNAATCTDGNPCTSADGCVNGTCLGAQSVDCADGNTCTVDYCSPTTGACQHASLDIACDDGDGCTNGDHCAAGLCVGGKLGCDDGNPCTADACDPSASVCVHTSTCADGLACTVDWCNPTSGCSHGTARAVQEAYIKATNPAGNDRFSVTALDGDTLVVGAPGESGCSSGVNGAQTQLQACTGSGAAYVYRRKGGLWAFEAYLKAAHPDAGDAFGTAVAISGDTLVVGAVLEASAATQVDGDATDNSGDSPGAGYVFSRKNGIWSQTAYLKGSTAGAQSGFGSAVAISGSTVIVGAPNQGYKAAGESSWNGAGAAYVFDRAGVTWSEAAVLTASNGDPDDRFGAAVGISADLALVGAPGESSAGAGVGAAQDNNSAPRSGAAYAFSRSAGTWQQTAYLKASNAAGEALFGGAVAVDGMRAIVGATGESGNGLGAALYLSTAGAAYIFSVNATGWTQDVYLRAPFPHWNTAYGSAVAISGNRAVVGSIGDWSGAVGVDGDGSSDWSPWSGAAFVYRRPANAWILAGYLKAAAPDVQDQFGSSVAISGSLVAVGATNEASAASGVGGDGLNNSLSLEGAAYAFQLTDSPCDDGNTCTVDACSAVEGCQFSVTTGPCDDGNTCTVGESCDSTTCTGGAAVDCNDNNPCTNDGCDLATGCTHTDGTAACDDGNACTGPDNCASGSCASTPLTCDDGDGCTADSCDTSTGCVHGPTPCDDGNSCTSDVCVKDSSQSGHCSHTGIGDGTVCNDASACTSGDTCASQVCVGTPIPCADDNACTSDLCNSATGCVFVTTDAALAYVKSSDPFAQNQFGRTVAVDGDTFVVGAPGEGACATGVNGAQDQAVAATSCPQAGAAYVFVRTAGVWHQQAYLKASNTDANDRFGATVAISGDTIVVGAPMESSGGKGVGSSQSDNSAANAGAAYVFVRTGGVWSQQAYLKASNTDPGDQFGVAVALSGSTLVVGAPGERSSFGTINQHADDNALPNAGAAYVFVRSGSAWAQEAYLKAGYVQKYFGQNVAVAGDLVMVGEPGDSSHGVGVNNGIAAGGAIYSGAAYAFARTGGVWTQEAYIKSPNPTANDFFGTAVAVSGTWAVISAAYEGGGSSGVGGNPLDKSKPASGAAWLLHREVDGWKYRAYIKASNAAPNADFGVSVAMSGHSIVIGADRESSGAVNVDGNQNDTSLTAAGAAYVFAVHDGTVQQVAYLKASNPVSGDGFGGSVAIGADLVAVGADSEDGGKPGINADPTSNQAGDAGATYLFGHRAGCDDNNPCTVDSCDPASGCAHTTVSLGSACDDGNACTVGDSCGGDVCAGIAKNCDDANTCTDDACALGGTCTHLPNAQAVCDDGNVCTTNYCVSGQCGNIGAPTCDDNRTCTLDVCDPVTGCGHTVISSSAEWCNNVDDNCDGVTDEGCDDDGDGYCDSSMSAPNYVAVCPNGKGDCNDTDPTVHPGAQDFCGGTVDHDCDGLIGGINATGCTSWYVDMDGDGYGWTGIPWKCACSAVVTAGYVWTAAVAGDCNDNNSAVNPGAVEWCDDTDNNCNTLFDEGCDQDGDGYCAAGKVVVGKPACCYGGGGDCNDQNVGVNPTAPEICNGYDDNCNGITDESTITCNDNNPCTVDACSGYMACTHSALAAGATPAGCSGVNSCNSAGECACVDGLVSVAIDGVDTCVSDSTAWVGSMGLISPQFVDNGDGTLSTQSYFSQWQQADNGAGVDWTSAQAYCDGLTTGGYTDWRLPTSAELHSLVGLLGPIHGPVEMSGDPTGTYWSAVPVAGASSYWSVNFNDGTTSGSAPTSLLRTRCIRTQPRYLSTPRWQVNAASGYVVDNWSSFHWQRVPAPIQYTLADATTYCASLTTLGGGWRVPYARELNTIADRSQPYLALDPAGFPYTGGGLTWTANYGNNWVVDFQTGALLTAIATELHWVRCIKT